MCVIVGIKKLRDPQGISSLNIIVSIADHSHTVLLGDPEGSPSKIAIKVHYDCKVPVYMGIKVMTQHFCQST